jgi:hypothetical protein
VDRSNAAANGLAPGPLAGIVAGAALLLLAALVIWLLARRPKTEYTANAPEEMATHIALEEVTAVDDEQFLTFHNADSGEAPALWAQE